MKHATPHQMVDCLPHWYYQFLPGQLCSLFYSGQGGVHPSQYRYSPQHLLGSSQEYIQFSQERRRGQVSIHFIVNFQTSKEVSQSEFYNNGKIIYKSPFFNKLQFIFNSGMIYLQTKSKSIKQCCNDLQKNKNTLKIEMFDLTFLLASGNIILSILSISLLVTS